MQKLRPAQPPRGLPLGLPMLTGIRYLRSEKVITRTPNATAHRSRGCIRATACFFLFSVLVCIPGRDAAAFSLETHLYIATKVLDDALTGSISVCAGEAAAGAIPGSPCSKRYPIPVATLEA